MVNNMIKKQRGVSFWGLSTALAILGFFIYMGLTIFPLYNEKLTVRYVMQGVASKPEAAKLSITEARKLFLKGQMFLVVLVLRSFTIKRFRIPAASMMPTLLIGDFILVDKYAYGIRLPILNKKIIENKIPERGDIVVFRYPLDPSIPFIKRVVGLPGDKYLYQDKILYINGQPVKQVGAGTYKAVGAGKMMDGATVSKEILPNIEYSILKSPDRPSLTFEGFVPEGHYFVLGDNRDNSKDSRYWGFVPDANLVGRAFMIWMNFDWKKSPWIDQQRIGMMIK